MRSPRSAATSWRRLTRSVPRTRNQNAEQAKDDADPTKDHGGKLFEVKGVGSVDNFYKGRRQQIMRIGLAAFWGSCGDFFVGR